VVEALVFASDHALPIKEIINVLDGASEKDVQAAVEQLNREYEETERSFFIRNQSGGLRFVTRPDYHPYLKSLFRGRRKARLSRAALETLSIVAYKQPVSRPIVEAIRGVNIDGVITTLLERRMVTIAGRSDGPGRPLLYKTTDDFLEYFGIKDLQDLPNLREIKDLFQDGEVFKNLPDEVVAEATEYIKEAEAEEFVAEEETLADDSEESLDDEVDEADIAEDSPIEDADTDDASENVNDEPDVTEDDDEENPESGDEITNDESGDLEVDTIETADAPITDAPVAEETIDVQDASRETPAEESGDGTA